MKEYKVCRKCSHKNDIRSDKCQECGAIIRHIPPTAEAVQDKPEGKTEGDKTTEGKKKKYKECGICRCKNYDIDRPTCEECGADIYGCSVKVEAEEPISDKNTEKVKPCVSEKESGVRRIKLVNKVDGYEIIIPVDGEYILGRKGSLDIGYFSTKKYISNEHIKIRVEENSYIVNDLDSTNGTVIIRPDDNFKREELEPGKNYELFVGNRIILADTEFIVELL